jgi:hypothetical protein
MTIVAVVTSRGELGADFDGFRGADGIVAGESFFPVVLSLKRVSAGLVGAGEATVRAGLLPWRAGNATASPRSHAIHLNLPSAGPPRCPEESCR